MFLNTSKVKDLTKKKMQQVRLRGLMHNDVKRFSKTASFSVFDDSYNQLESRIMYNVHALEKGLSRRNHQRLGFGKNALKNLNDALVVYVKNGYPLNSFSYLQGCSILQSYEAYHRQKNFDVTFIHEIVNDDFFKQDVSDVQTGFQVVAKKDKEHNQEKTFFDICENRTSVRDFEGTPVELSKVMNVLDVAKKTPSVCNRQGWEVYLIKDKDKIRQTLKLQHGFSGYSQPEYVLAITVLNSTFLSPVERNESFVDGGLFSMSVLYGLEQEGLAAVPLNAMMNSKQEKSIRNLLNIRQSANFIMFIAVGNFPEKSISPISARKSAEDFTIVI